MASKKGKKPKTDKRELDLWCDAVLVGLRQESTVENAMALADAVVAGFIARYGGDRPGEAPPE